MPSQVAIEIDVSADLSGIDQAQSALDDFNENATSGFLQTRAALDQMNGGFQEAIQSLQEFTQLRAQLKTQSGGQNQNPFAISQAELGGPYGIAGAGNAGDWTGAMGSDQLWGTGIAANSALPGRNFGLGVGGGAGAATRSITRNIAAALGLPATTPIGTVMARLSQMSPTGQLLTGLGMGGVMLGSSIGGVGGALLGAGGGALSGFEIGNMIMPGLGGIIGAAGGAIIGGLMSLFGGGSGAAKVHDTQIQQAGEKQMYQILDDFENFRTDYATAVNNESSIYNQMVSQFQRSQSKDIPTIELNNILTQMAQIQDQRVARQQLQSMMAVPEFASGGLVPATADGGIHAIVHPGEFVMSQAAVQRIGASVLQGLNSGSGSEPRAGGGGLQITLDPDSGAWLEQALAANPKALAKGIGVIVRSGGPVSRALRG